MPICIRKSEPARFEADGNALYELTRAVARRFFEDVEMTALTVRLPDEKHRRLKAMAKSRGTPINRLIDAMTTLMLAKFDAETRYQLRAARGKGENERGLELLLKAHGVSQ